MWGDSYTNPPNGPQESPNTHNVMSYQGLDACVDQFSRLQIGVMLYNLFILNGTNGAVWRNPIHTFDDFEPDNSPEMLSIFALKIRSIAINEIQERNFHQQWNRIVGPIGFLSQCDVDWVRFVAPCNITLPITTAAIPRYLNATANTRLTLFAANATTQLAQNDNISATNLFSNIVWNFIAGQTYFIRVENMSPNVTGYYQLSIPLPTGTIVGSDNLCTSPNTYNLSNLPAGATVAWSATPANLVTPSTGNGATFTTSRVGTLNGNVTLIANISTPTCGLIQTAIKTLGIGSINTSFNATYQVGSGYPITANGINYVRPSQPITLNLKSLTGTSGITYTIEKVYGNSLIFTSGNTASFSLPNYSASNPANGLITLLCKANAACSNMTVQAYSFSTQGQCGGCRSLFTISPNPASESIKIEEIDANTGLLKTTNNTITAIDITDKMGNTIYSKKVNSKLYGSSIIIPTSQFKNDVYTIKIFKGIDWEVQTIIIKH